MISTSRLWERVSVLTKDGTSGYTNADDFNSDLISVTLMVQAMLCDEYQKTNKVSNWLINHIKAVNLTSSSTGQLTLPADYYRDLAIYFSYNGQYIETFDLNSNSLGITRTSPIRKMDETKGRVGYYYEDGTIVMEPNKALSVRLDYCKKAVEPKIAFTVVSSADDDYISIDTDNTVNTDFPEGLFNLFVYLLLEARGIEMKESLALEYSQLGLQRQITVDINP